MNKQLGLSTQLVISFTVTALRNYFGTQIQYEVDHMLTVRPRVKGKGKVIPLQARCGPECG